MCRDDQWCHSNDNDSERRKSRVQRRCKLHIATQSASSVARVTSLRFASNSCANFFDTLLQLRKMRPWPVDLFAIRTATEVVVIYFCKRLEFIDYFGLGCILQ